MAEFKFNLCEKCAARILDAALSTGGEFAEVYMEETTNEFIEMTSKQISDVVLNKVRGASIRVIKDGSEVVGSLTDCSVENMVELATKLAESFSGTKNTTIAPFVTKEVKKIVDPKRVRGKNWDEEVNLMQKASDEAFAYSNEIIQVRCSVNKKEQDMFVFASDGTCQGDYRCNTRFAISVVASDGKNMQDCHDSYGRNQGMEMFNNFNVDEFAKTVAFNAVEMLHADEMTGGDIPVVIHNGFGGVILHEACVHGLEATSVAKGMSVFCGKLGQKVASDIVNAVDTGVDENAWGSINVDDEGTPAQRNLLIENGILKSYLVDKRNAKKMNHPITGSSRRESYKYVTTSRMTNTYFLPGNSTFDEIIKNTKYGLFAKKMGGGSVNPATGEFNFAVTVGYLIEDGKITKPVRGATLVGSGKDVLMRIDMIADNLDVGQGMCGSLSGSIPTNVGQPTIRLSHMTVGGKGGSK